MKTPYPFHKIALAPLLPGAHPSELKNTATAAVALGEDKFKAFLIQQGLAPLWDKHIVHCNTKLPLSDKFCHVIHRARLLKVGEYLLQRNSLGHIKDILEEAGVTHVVFKGAHTRELYYNSPSQRPAVDIDLLVHPQDKMNAIKAFQAKGYEFVGVPENISHEACLIKGKIIIDLHWDILRPGRTRIPMASTLLATRHNFGSHWGMSHEATVFMMLVHPVFTKYSTTPDASLVRLVDLVYVLDKNEINWQQVISWLEQAGVKTCGWITLTWLEMLTGTKVPHVIMDALKPGPLRQRYLRNWLASGRSHRWFNKRLLVQLGFTLPAHDNCADAIRAAWQAGVRSSIVAMQFRLSQKPT